MIVTHTKILTNDKIIEAINQMSEAVKKQLDATVRINKRCDKILADYKLINELP